MQHTTRRTVRRAAWVVIAVAAMLGSSLAADGAAPEPSRWVTLDGRDWTQFAPAEKEAYVAGFLAGAASAVAGNSDTVVVRSTVDSLYRTRALQFPFGHMVYANQLDEFYWWENHVPTPLYLALSAINQRLRQ